MVFVKVSGLAGKVYVPREDLACHKKHDCKDCFSCQMCSDERCMLCRCHKEAFCDKKEKKR